MYIYIYIIYIYIYIYIYMYTYVVPAHVDVAPPGREEAGQVVLGRPIRWQGGYIHTRTHTHTHTHTHKHKHKHKHISLSLYIYICIYIYIYVHMWGMGHGARRSRMQRDSAPLVWTLDLTTSPTHMPCPPSRPACWYARARGWSDLYHNKFMNSWGCWMWTHSST